MTTALVCKSCGFMSTYWDDETGGPTWEEHIEQSMPIACKVCGIGEYKMVSNINPALWCDTCCIVKQKCKCQSAAWSKIW